MTIRFIKTTSTALLLMGGALVADAAHMRDIVSNVDEMFEAGIGYGDYIIAVSDRIVNNLTEKELESILLHERAHIVLGHAKDACEGRVPTIMTASGKEVAVCEAMELEADAYSADRVGPATMLSAFSKIGEIISKDEILKENALKTITISQYKEAMENLVNSINSNLDYRIKALRKMSH